MYICLCNAITDRDVRAAASSGCTSVSDVYRHCGGQPQCGKCVPFVRAMLAAVELKQASVAVSLGGCQDEPAVANPSTV